MADWISTSFLLALEHPVHYIDDEADVEKADGVKHAIN